MSDSTDTSTGGRPKVMEPEVLWDGPLFADEIAWPGGITDDLVERYELDGRRLVLAKEANKGVCSIYFRREHWEAALIRYAHRYRAPLELILRQGISGERRLFQQGWLEADVDLFYEIIPGLDENEHSPVVYKIVVTSLTIPEYLDIARALEGRVRFEPKSVLEQVEDLDESDGGLFNPFIRHHLIETAESKTKSVKNRGKHTSTTIGAALDEEYVLTAEGKEAIPAIPAVYERMIELGEFEPLEASIDQASGHLPVDDSIDDGFGQDVVDELMRDITAGEGFD